MERRGKTEVTFRTHGFYPCLLMLGKGETVYFAREQKERKIMCASSIDKLRIEANGVLD